LLCFFFWVQVLNAWLNPWEAYKRARDEDMLGVYIWVLVYFAANWWACFLIVIRGRM
jgi:hypothetical protein